MESSPSQRQKGMMVVTPNPAVNQQQQLSQSPQQQPIYCVLPPAEQLTLQQGYVIVAPVAGAASIPVIVPRMVAEPRRRSPTKKVKQPKPALHADSFCINCHTTKTTMWRRNLLGQPECNSCNLYWRKNERPRPLELAGKKILSRKRVKPVPSGFRSNSFESNGGSSSSSVTDYDYLGGPLRKQFIVSLPTTAAVAHHHQQQGMPDFGREQLKWESMKTGNDTAAGMVSMKTKDGQDARGFVEEEMVHGGMGDQQVVQQQEKVFDFEDFFNADSSYEPHHMGAFGHEGYGQY